VGFQWARRIDDGRTEADMDGVCLRGIIDRLGLTGDGNLISSARRETQAGATRSVAASLRRRRLAVVTQSTEAPPLSCPPVPNRPR